MGLFFESITSDIIAVVVTILLLIRLYYIEAHRYWERLGVPQISPSFPFGNARKIILRYQNLAETTKEFYDIAKSRGHKFVGIYFFSRKALLAVDPQLVRNILVKDFQYFHDRGLYVDEINDPLSAHLFSLEGAKWRNLRAKLTPAYTSSKIKFMFHAFTDVGDQMVLVLNNLSRNGRPVEMKDILARFTTDVIGSTAFGIECNSLKDPDTEFRKMGRRAFTQTVTDSFKVTIIRSFPWLARRMRLGIFASSITSFFHKVVRETIEFREKNGVARNDFMQLLIQLKNKGQVDDENNSKANSSETVSQLPVGTTLTLNEAAAQAFIFFLAGFETTATTMTFAMFEMSINREVQEKARKEIVDVLNKYEGQITYEAINELHYLDMVVLETLRKHPPAAVYMRTCTKDYQIPGTEIVIAKGVPVLVNSLALHRDSQYFPNPEQFDPERFSEENKSNIPDYTYVPFGDGPRVCIGQRMAMIQVKVGLAQLLKNFSYTLNSKTSLPLRMETKGIITTPIGGIWLNLTKI